MKTIWNIAAVVSLRKILFTLLIIFFGHAKLLAKEIAIYELNCLKNKEELFPAPYLFTIGPKAGLCIDSTERRSAEI